MKIPNPDSKNESPFWLITSWPRGFIPQICQINGMSRFRHAQRAFEDLRPYLWPLVVLLIVSLLAVPMTLIFPLPVKLLVDSVVGSQPLPGYLTIFVGLQVSQTLALWLAIGILIAAAVLTSLPNLVNGWYSNKVENQMQPDVRTRLC